MAIKEGWRFVGNRYTNKNGFLRSGGSDYHGVNKKNVEMAVGKGNLKITSDLIKDWC